MERNYLITFCIYNLHSRSSSTFLIIMYTIDQRVRPQCEISSFKCSGQCTRIGAEIGTIRTSAMTEISVLANTSTLYRGSKVSYPPDSDYSTRKFFFDSFFEMFFNTIHFHGRLKNTIRKMV